VEPRRLHHTCRPSPHRTDGRSPHARAEVENITTEKHTFQPKSEQAAASIEQQKAFPQRFSSPHAVSFSRCPSQIVPELALLFFHSHNHLPRFLPSSLLFRLSLTSDPLRDPTFFLPSTFLLRSPLSCTQPTPPHPPPSPLSPLSPLLFPSFLQPKATSTQQTNAHLFLKIVSTDFLLNCLSKFACVRGCATLYPPSMVITGPKWHLGGFICLRFTRFPAARVRPPLNYRDGIATTQHYSRLSNQY
jgi:hypothetical protein